jgi:hypothetical protein
MAAEITLSCVSVMLRTNVQQTGERELIAAFGDLVCQCRRRVLGAPIGACICNHVAD